MKNKEKIEILPQRLVTWAKWFVKQQVSEGDICVDATVGNGFDTLFLAECVGPEGKVYGFDIQQSALDNTKKLLMEAGLLDRVYLFHDSHSHLDTYLSNNTVKAVMFNLGYLPGGDHTLTTKPETTLQALKAALPLLTANGIITVVSYRGHPGAIEEYNSVKDFMSNINSKKYRVFSIDILNQEHLPPVLFVVHRYR
ncbi:MAG TPA: 16S rRNA (cytosine(1402)-N(4))-methyltransferase [Syntrophaceticus sp.]|nr:16S rRNA (cytosine(1402)-N(4))-methyltransferase [Syntrophaceticus sp.]